MSKDELACVEKRDINGGGENKQRKQNDGIPSGTQGKAERQWKREVPMKSAISNYAVINYNYHNW